MIPDGEGSGMAGHWREPEEMCGGGDGYPHRNDANAVTCRFPDEERVQDSRRVCAKARAKCFESAEARGKGEKVGRQEKGIICPQVGN